MRIEAVQQCRLHGAAPDLPLVEAAGADVGPGLDLPVALGRPVDQHRPCFVEGDAPADQVVGDAGLDRQLARRVVDAGDAGPLLGDHPPGDVFGRCRLGLLRATIAPLQGGAVAAGRCMPLGGRGLRDHGLLGALPGHGVLVGLAGGDAVRGIGVGRRHRLIHVCVLRLLGVLRPVDAGNVPGANEAAGRERLTLAKAGAAIGANRHRRQLHRLPVDCPPDRHLAVLLAHLVDADGVADGDVADDAGADVLPQRLDVFAGAEADGGAALVAVVAPRDPPPFDHADDVGEIEGAVRVEQRRTAVQAREIDVPGIERQHLVVALARPQIPPPHCGSGRPDDLDGARLGIDAVRLQSYVGAGLQRQVDDILFRRHGLLLSHVPGMITR